MGIGWSVKLLDRFDSMCYNTYIDIIIYFLLPNFIRMADRKTLQRQVLALWLCVKFEDSREELIFIYLALPLFMVLRAKIISYLYRY